MKQPPHNLLLIARESEALTNLNAGLVKKGFDCLVVPCTEDITELVSNRSPDAILVEIDGYMPAADIRQLITGVKEVSSQPVLVLLPSGMLHSIDSSTNVDDFLISPYDIGELILRIQRLLHKTGDSEDTEIIRSDGLKIDIARCEVTIEGRIIELTFKEYELLKFLASHPGRVHTRESLLDRVWGLDYYGGDRTVDVHIRRLRSKIENPQHDYIETVRNIGYRFRRDI